jgi:signal transduction histidine kinase
MSVDGVCLRLLAESAAAVGQGVDRFGPDVSSPAELARVVAGLAAAVESADLPPFEVPAATALARKALAALRADFTRRVSELAPPPPVTELLPLFLGFERVAAAIEPRLRDSFTDRMSGPDGLDLVVEVAHDLRSPLTSILFLAETLLRGRSGPVTPLQERQLGLIYSAAFGLSSVATDVVDLVRGRDRLTDLSPMPFSITEIMEAVRDIVRPIAEEKGLEVRIRPPARPARIGHPTALNRVLLNLTTNGLKFTDEGQVELVAIDGEGDLVTFTVRDTGRGIPPRAMGLLFEPFRRRERDQDYAFSGSGLGLSICRRLVEAMGGELLVDSAPGAGTAFSFALPLPSVPSEETLHGSQPALLG